MEIEQVMVREAENFGRDAVEVHGLESNLYMPVPLEELLAQDRPRK